MPARGATKDKPEKKKEKKSTKDKDAEKASDNVVVCKDYLGCRWDVSTSGTIGIYQAYDADGNATDFADLHGKIVYVKYDKGAMLQKKGSDEEDEGATNSRKKVSPHFLQRNH